MFILNERPLQVDTAFTHNELNYPANWLRISSQEEKEELGIVEVPDPTEFDDRFYWAPNNPKDLEQLKTEWKATVNRMTNSLLQPTDWMIIRKFERKIAISPNVVSYRNAVLSENSRLSELIEVATNVPNLIAAIDSLNWPADPNNAMI